MAKKIVTLDVLTEILKQVYKKTKEYTDGRITISLDSLRPLIEKNSDNIKINRDDIITLENTTNELSENVTDLQGKTYEYLGTDEINTVFDE